ncbi:MAG TPA: FTR1 family protein, partial [Anaerolineales bacterium]|nr:FTR1 family protein [Anaerolineales bacterium]
REGLEAALVLGVTFGVLNRLRRTELAPSAWLGIGVAVVVSVVAALLLFSVGAELEGRAEQIFEGLTLLLAAGLLTWMILWLGAHGRSMQLGLEREVEQAALTRQASAIFLVAFLAVVREGIETALFLSAAAFQDGQARVVAGGLAGIATSCVLGWLLYRATIRLNLRRFFQLTGFVLILFAAGLFSHAVGEFVEAGFLPALLDPAWNTTAYLSEASFLGSLARTVFGYSAEPTLLEVLAYAFYFAGVWVMLRWIRGRGPAPVMAAG